MLNYKVVWIKASANICTYMRSMDLHSFRSENRTSVISYPCQFLHITKSLQDVTTHCSCSARMGLRACLHCLEEQSGRNNHTQSHGKNAAENKHTGFPTVWNSRAHNMYLQKHLNAFTVILPHLFMLCSKTILQDLSDHICLVFAHLVSRRGLSLQSDVYDPVSSPDD